MPDTINEKSVEIRRLRGDNEARSCAHMMANSEPWITLRRSYHDSLRIFTDPKRELYVAEIQDEIIGFLVIQIEGSFTGYIQSIGITPSWRNKGFGSQLMEYAEKRIFREKPNVFVCVSSFNKKAHKFYKNLGYKQIGELENYFVKGCSEFILRKTIAPISEFKS